MDSSDGLSSLTIIPKGRWGNSGQTFVVGQRSWIAQHLIKELEQSGRKPKTLFKSEVGDEPLNGATLFLIAGVARPTEDDMDREEDLCRRAARTGAKVMYLSSCAVDRWEADSRVLSREGELYILGKRRCEQIVTGGPSGCGYALRAPVIFGPGQRLESDMLLPSIVRDRRAGQPTVIRDPLRPFQMVHVSDLVKAWIEHSTLGDPLPVCSLRTSPEITPLDLVSLAAPGHPVMLAHGWQHFRKYDERRQSEIRHIGLANAPFRREDVVSTVAWYDEEDVPQLIPAGTHLLEG